MEPIAITGFSFKLAQGAEDDASFWEILEKGRNVMTPYPQSRAKHIDAFCEANGTAQNVLPCRGGHFLNVDPAAFDAPFFSITPKEAAAIDPAQRLLLETAYRALENAGISLEQVAGTNTAVFSGSMTEDYRAIAVKSPDEAPTHVTSGVSAALLANRISWFYDLQGPSMQVDTACSSSMIAVHLACQSLQRGESSMALVAGSNLILSPEMSMYMGNLNLLSPDGLSYSFDQRANGYARGEGVVVIVAKRLVDALRDGDVIRSIIRATSSNSDGRTPSITQPSVAAQEKLIRGIYKACRLDLGMTRYVEAHGTGTQVGDTAEMKALGRVFRSSRSREEPLYVGSLKANFGHTEGASGLASILKGTMILEKGIIPPNALFENLNPKIPARLNNIQIPTKPIPWPSEGLRRISINSFGFGGSNGHLILDDAWSTLEALAANGASRSLAPLSLPNLVQDEKAIQEPPSCAGKPDEESGTSTLGKGQTSQHVLPHGSTRSTFELLVWSARSETAIINMLQDSTAYFADKICGSGQRRLKQLAYTLASRRSVMNWRSFAVVNGTEGCTAGSLNPSRGVRTSRERGLAFVFTGQGAQYAHMGLDLLQYHVFESSMARANRIFLDLGEERSIIDLLQDDEGAIDQPSISQPLCTALQLALVDLLKSFGLAPDLVVGHSSGEIAAAYCVGALPFESACTIAYHRGRLAQKMVISKTLENQGAMMSVNIPESQVGAYLEKVGLEVGEMLCVACVNSPSNVTLSGKENYIDQLKEHFDAEGIFNQKLRTGVAYHSPAMQSVADEYLSSISSLTPRPSPCSSAALMVSSVTGLVTSVTSLSDGQYWVDNLTSPVLFADALRYAVLVATKTETNIKAVTDVVEIGPHGALRRSIHDTLKQAIGSKSFRYSPVLSRFDPPVKSVLSLVGALFTHGYPVSITAANQQGDGIRESPYYLVDLPQYPFDHSQLHWHESRISRDWRFREAVPRTVLGTRSPDWNPLLPRWRKLLSVEEMPWLAEHVIDKTILFPATGSIVMALEAVKQMANPHKHTLGYHVRDAAFTSPIIIYPGQKTEVMIALHPLHQAYEKTSPRFEARLFAYVDFWTQCFSAIIHVEYEEGATEVDSGYEACSKADSLVRRYKESEAASSKCLDKSTFYQWLKNNGLEYGDRFSLAEDLHWDGHDRATARVNVQPPFEQPYAGVVHPAILDAACHVSYAGPSEGAAVPLPTMVPYKIRAAWIAAEGWQHPVTKQLRVAVESRLKIVPGTGYMTNIIILGDGGGGNDGGVRPLCQIEDFQVAPLMSNDPSGGSGDATLAQIHLIEWKPQLSFLSTEELRNYCSTVQSTLDQEGPTVDYIVKLRKTLKAVVRLRARELQAVEPAAIPSHIREYLSWLMNRYGLSEGPDTDTENCDGAGVDATLERLILERPAWKVLTEISQYLTNIGRSTKDDESNQGLFSTKAQEMHTELLYRVCDARLVRYLELLVHQSPGLKILEVGSEGNAGPMAEFLLSTLCQFEDRMGGMSFCAFVYADTSAKRLDKVQERLKKYGHRVTYKLLDATAANLTDVGGGTALYDLVVACHLSHTARSLATSLQDFRSALKPGGHLALYDLTAADAFITDFAFGAISDGWNVAQHPVKLMMTDNEWHSALVQNGFSGNDLVFQDYQCEAAHQVSVILSSSLAPKPTALSAIQGRILLVADDEDEHQNSLAKSLVKEWALSSRQTAHIFPISACVDAKVEQIDLVVFLADAGVKSLVEVSEVKFELIKNWVQRSTKLLWVTSADIQDSSVAGGLLYACSGLKDGFLRTVRSEFNDKRIVSLSLEDSIHDEKRIASCVTYITKVLNSTFGPETISAELEVRVQNGELFTPRIVDDVDSNATLSAHAHPITRTEPWLPGPPLRLDMGMRGHLETLRFEDDTFYHIEDLAPDAVEIEARAWAVNFRDVFGALGRLENEAFAFGSDCAGVVTRVGASCSTRVKPGDRVCMLDMGCMRTFPRAAERLVVPIPDSMAFEEACAVINPAITAWQALIEVGRVRAGDRVLIHSAAGATGQLAVQIAQRAGAEVFATVGYNDKKRLLVEQYGIPEDHIFYSRNTTFASGIMRATRGYGVDVVLNSLVGESLRASWECIAPYGRFIEIGKADINANSSLPMTHFAKNVMFCAVDLRHLFLDTARKDISARLMETAMGLAGDGQIGYPKPLHLYEVDAVEEAFRYVQSGKNTGRTVIRVNRSTPVQKYLVQQRNWSFKDDATYLVAGGLGGIGRSILRWLVKRGATHLIVPSRSGLKDSGPAADLIRELSAQGITIVAPKCDVSSYESISQVLHESSIMMPPIRGCINAAMELNDAIYDNMAYQQWSDTIRSKVSSSWNLHLLAPDVDFFILLSSNSGVIGHPGQTNYAAGCTFQDSLAHYRTHHGQNALSIDLGIMGDIGRIAETEALKQHLGRTQGVDSITIAEREFLSLLDMHCDPARPKNMACQISMGLTTPADRVARGLEPLEFLNRPLFGYFRQPRGALQQQKGANTVPEAAELFRTAVSAEGRVAVVVEALARKLARALAIKPDDIDVTQPLHAFGVDSLVAVELRNWMGSQFAADVPVFEIMGGSTVLAIGELVTRKSQMAQTES